MLLINMHCLSRSCLHWGAALLLIPTYASAPNQDNAVWLNGGMSVWTLDTSYVLRNIIHPEPTKLLLPPPPLTDIIRLRSLTSPATEKGRRHVIFQWGDLSTHLQVDDDINGVYPSHRRNYNKPWMKAEQPASASYSRFPGSLARDTLSKVFFYFDENEIQHSARCCAVLKNIMQEGTPGKQFDGRLNSYHNIHACSIYLSCYAAYSFSKIWQLRTIKECRENTERPANILQGSYVHWRALTKSFPASKLLFPFNHSN